MVEKHGVHNLTNPGVATSIVFYSHVPTENLIYY